MILSSPFQTIKNTTHLLSQSIIYKNPPNTTHFCSHITHRGGEIFSYKLNVECARWIVNIFQIFFSWLITAHSLHLWPGSWGGGREEVASRCRSWDRQIRGKNVIISGRARMQFHVNTKSRDCCSLRGISPSKSASGVALAKIYGRQELVSPGQSMVAQKLHKIISLQPKVWVKFSKT